MDVDSDRESEPSQTQTSPQTSRTQTGRKERDVQEEEMRVEESRDLNDGGYDPDQAIDDKRKVRAAYRNLDQRFNGRSSGLRDDYERRVVFSP
jgi:hypothetical protein